jgi:hypothetical protein
VKQERDSLRASLTAAQARQPPPATYPPQYAYQPQQPQQHLYAQQGGPQQYLSSTAAPHGQAPVHGHVPPMAGIQVMPGGGVVLLPGAVQGQHQQGGAAAQARPGLQLSKSTGSSTGRGRGKR